MVSWCISLSPVRLTNSCKATSQTQTAQGGVLGPLLCTLLTFDSVASLNNTSIIKFADDTTVIGLILEGTETDSRTKVLGFMARCQENKPLFDHSETQEEIVDPRREKRWHSTI